MAARWWSCSLLSIAPAMSACRCVCRCNTGIRAVSVPAWICASVEAIAVLHNGVGQGHRDAGAGYRRGLRPLVARGVIGGGRRGSTKPLRDDPGARRRYGPFPALQDHLHVDHDERQSADIAPPGQFRLAWIVTR